MRALLPSLAQREEKGVSKRTLAAREELFSMWMSDPWDWLTGRDLDGTPIIWTTDERDSKAPVKPFPFDKPYLKRMTYDVIYSPHPVFIDKPRQMMVTTLLILLADWSCRAKNSRKVLLSKHKESEAIAILRDKVRAVHKRLPVWVQEMSPISLTPADRIDYRATGSMIQGVAENFAAAEARGNTASIVMVDEAALQSTLGEILAAVLPMAASLWVLSTPGWGRGERVFKSYLSEEVG